MGEDGKGGVATSSSSRCSSLDEAHFVRGPRGNNPLYLIIQLSTKRSYSQSVSVRPVVDRFFRVSSDATLRFNTLFSTKVIQQVASIANLVYFTEQQV